MFRRYELETLAATCRSRELVAYGAVGWGFESLRDFYANHFLSQIAPDIEIVSVSRTIGQGRVVDELIMRFTHSIRMDWLLPGIPPTAKRVEVPLVAIIQFEGDKIAHEHLYWDQASVLVQIGLLDRTLPVRGGEIAAQVLNPTQPMNELIRGRDEQKHVAFRTFAPSSSSWRSSKEPRQNNLSNLGHPRAGYLCNLSSFSSLRSGPMRPASFWGYQDSMKSQKVVCPLDDIVARSLLHVSEIAP